MTGASRAASQVHREGVAAALAAITVHRDGGYSWFGERLPGGDGDDVTRRLSWRLYLDYYAQGRPTPTLDRRLSPAASGRTDLTERLSAGNASRESLQPGWRVMGLTDGDDLEIVRAGITIQVPPSAFCPRAEGDLRPGSEGALRVPGELRARSPGYYTALGERGLPMDQSRGRIYWSLTPRGAVSGMTAVTEALNAAGLPFSFKVLADSSAYTRCDAGVLYVRRDDVNAALAVAERFSSAHPWALRPVVPALTLRIAEGIGYADDPENGESFGMHRCRLIAEAAVAAWHEGRPTPERALDAVEARFAACGLSLDQPYCDPGHGQAPPAALRRSSRRAAPEGEDELAQAVAIGVHLRDSALWHRGRCAWLSPGLERRPGSPPHLVVRPTDPWLYAGTAGIGLFLAELHAATRAGGLRETAVGAIHHALEGAEGPRGAGRPGLYSGSAGVAYAAARASALLGSGGLRDRAEALLAAEPPWDAEADLHGGLAGAAMGRLAVLGASAGEDLDEIGDALLARAEREGEAISWATGPSDARLANLLGMAHGTSGIGLCLAELAAATGRDDLADAARAAFAHERARFDPTGGGWPDLRSEGRTGAPGPSLTNAWCHGAPGIALARLRAWELLRDDQLIEEARTAFEITASEVRTSLLADGADFCLCHGLAGNADVLMEGARRLPGADRRLDELVREVASTGVERYPASGRRWPCGSVEETPALMLGLAGIGLFLLRLVDPSIPSVLTIDPTRDLVHGGRRSTPPPEVAHVP